MTDQDCYAKILCEKFSYTNTFYDREPSVDFSKSHPDLANRFDFILSADVFEHVAPPVERAMHEVWQMLKPTGFLVATVPCTPDDQMREHFPELFEYRVVPLGESSVLINRRRDGTLETLENIVLHEGHGSTLEMRQFGTTGLKAHLTSAGFSEVYFFNEDRPEIGILFDRNVSQPLVARKSPFELDRVTQALFAADWRSTQDALGEEKRRCHQLSQQMKMAARSRWVRLGRKLGVGPRFDQ
jgi:SAM-dependent methyltransferase